MNTLDLKRKALGWMARLEGDSDSGAAGASAGSASDSQAGENDSNNGGDTGGGGGMDTSYGGMDAKDFGANEDNALGSGWGGESLSDIAAQEANRLAAQVDAANPAKSAMNPMDSLMAVSSGFGTMATDNRGINSGFDGGWTLGVADRMSDLGYGDREGLNVNNRTQSAAELSASSFADNKLMPAVAGLITGAVPGAGLAMAGVRSAGRVASGQTTLGQEVKNFAIDYGSSKLAGAINSKIGSAIGPENMANLGLISSASKAFGGPGMPNVGASVVSGALNVAGISKTGFNSQNNPAADNGFTAPGTNYGGNDSTPDTPVAPTTPTASDVLSDSIDTNLNMNLWGSIDGAGWKAAKANYINSKRT